MSQKLVIDCSLTRHPNEREQYIDLTPEEIAQQELDAEEAMRIAWAMLRAERGMRLLVSDWTALPDAPLDAAALEAWREYRRALRELPAVTEDPTSPDWPRPPA